METDSRRTVPVLVLAAVVLSMLLLGLPTVFASANAGAMGVGLQCLEGQIATADGNGCLLAPPTATPVPSPPTADTEAGGQGEANAEGEGEVGSEESPGEGEDGPDSQACNAESEEGAEGDRCAPSGPDWCTEGQTPEEDDCKVEPPRCPKGFAENAEGACYEVLDRNHPCIIAGRAPADVTTNAVLATYTYIPASGECVTQTDFRQRVQNFEATAEKEREALVALRGVTDEVVALEVELDGLDEELLLVRRDLLAAEVEARFAEIRRDAKDRELEAVRAELEDQRELFKREAVEAYMGGNNAEAFAGAILTSSDVNQLEATIDYASAILDDQQATVDRVTDLEARTQELVEELSDAIEVARRAAADIRAVEQDVERLMTERQIVLAERESQVLVEAEAIAAIREDKELYAAELGSHAEESKEIEGIILEAQFLQSGQSSAPGAMYPPLDPLIMGSGFGPRIHPILGYVRQHDGIDMSAPSGALIRATADGTVIVAGPMGGYGNAVVIDHGDLVSTLYAHQSSIAVSLGDTVARGDIIGAVGSTGLSTGPHLHFETRLNGVPVDPMPYLIGTGERLELDESGEDTAGGEWDPILESLAARLGAESAEDLIEEGFEGDIEDLSALLLGGGDDLVGREPESEDPSSAGDTFINAGDEQRADSAGTAQRGPDSLTSLVDADEEDVQTD